jgi:hypothetical protein
MKSQAYVFDSASGAVAKVNAPLLLEGLARPAEYQEVAKAVVEAKGGSRRLREKYGVTLDGVICATRPFDFALYAYATTLNTYHARAVRAKAKDIVGRAWQIAGDDGPAKERATAFFTHAFGEQSLADGLGNVWTDYEALGNGYCEVVPIVRGDEPAELAHVPATEMWVRLDGLGFVQQKAGEYSHFKRWGLAPERFDAELKANDPLLRGGVTAVKHFCRYSPWSLHYGIPPIMPAWGRLCLAVLESEYNLAFFSNSAIPDYAVVLKGDWADTAEDLIREYFRRHLKGQHHKTLVLQTAENGEIQFEKLTSDNAKEGSFRLLRQDCRDEILQAHGVPPQKVGIVQTGTLGGNLASEQAEEYKVSIVEPGRQKASEFCNSLIEAMGVDGLTFRWQAYSTEDEERNMRVDTGYVNARVLLPNEVRAERFPTMKPLEGGDEFPGQAAADAVAAIGQVQQEIARMAAAE